MKYVGRLVVAAMAALSAVGVTSTGLPIGVSHAQENVTYLVDSPDFASVDGIDYFDGSRRVSLRNVALPWQITLPLTSPRSLGFDGAEVRANWRPVAQPGRWVAVRLYVGPTLICRNVLDVGNAACYGSTIFDSNVDV